MTGPYKVLSHPRRKVFAAWMNPEALAQWYGRAGLSIENHEADIRERGVWCFDMVGEFAGRQQRFSNLMLFLGIVANKLIVVDYGTPGPTPPSASTWQSLSLNRWTARPC